MPQQDSRLFTKVLQLFDQLHHAIFRKHVLFLAVVIILLPLGFWASQQLAVRGMPAISRHDILMKVNWQEPIGIAENVSRIKWVQAEIAEHLQASEADVGIPSYLLQLSNTAIQESTLYLDFNSIAEKEQLATELSAIVAAQYPRASVKVEEAPNAFELLFQGSEAYLSYRWRPNELQKQVDNDSLLALLPIKAFKKGASLGKESNVVLSIQQHALLQYGVATTQLFQLLERLLTSYEITKLSSFSEETPIVLEEEKLKDFEAVIRNNSIRNKEGITYPLAKFVSINYQERYKQIMADDSGPYFSVMMEQQGVSNTLEAIQKLNAYTADQGLVADIQGAYFSNKKQLKEITYVLLIAVILLYFILAAQFESFWQPLIVIFTLPFGISGALLFLWAGGASLNVMSGIGMVVMLGIMVNDAILKIDTINRNLAAMMPDQIDLYTAIHEAGLVRLKPILMTSITTLLALSPVLVLGGLGAELQKPLVLSVMGGLTIGTGTALFLVPVLYVMMKKKV